MRYLVHIGYPKAASTWLQKNLFSGANGSFVPLLRDKPKVGNQKSGGSLFYDSGTRTAVRAFDSDRVRVEIAARTEATAPVTVLSNEAWCHPFTGNEDVFRERIHATLPKAKILIVIRNQPEIILSSYFHYLVKRRGTCSLSAFLRGATGFSLPTLNYVNIIGNYDRMFGRDNVVILIFEDLRESPQGFVAPLYRAFDLAAADLPSTPENVRDAQFATALSLFPRINQLIRPGARDVVFRMFSSSLFDMAGLKQKHLDTISHETDDYFCAGNRHLAKRINRELSSYGYPL